MKINKLFLILFLSIFLIGNVSALFPISHKFVFDETIKSNIDSTLFNDCKKYPDLCYAGSELVDVSVLYYYSNKDTSGLGRRYLVTHESGFCDRLLQNAVGELEKSCASGCLVHHAEDYPSHTIMVPYSIKSSFMPNSFLHVFSEQHLDNIVISKNSNIQSEVIASLDSYKTCVPLFKRVLQGDKDYYGVELDALFNNFINEIQTEKSFRPSWDNISAIPTTILAIYTFAMLLILLIILLIIFKRLRYKERRTIFNWISLIFLIIILGILFFILIAKVGGMGFNTFVMIIKPISSLVPIGDGDMILQNAIQNTKDVLIQGEGWYTTNTGGKAYKDASGQYELQQADNEIIFPQYIILSIIIIVLVLFLYFNFRGKGKQVKETFNL